MPTMCRSLCLSNITCELKFDSIEFIIFVDVLVVMRYSPMKSSTGSLVPSSLRLKGVGVRFVRFFRSLPNTTIIFDYKPLY